MLQTRLALSLILASALLLRLLFFTGFFGSDEVTYTEQALAIAQGSWQRSDYIGAVRLGVSLPVGFLMWLFGNTEFVANLWCLLCSLGEIVLVYVLARHFWGERAALLSSLILAFTPLHAHYAGRLMADPPLAFFISLTFFGVIWGDRNNSRLWYLVAGLAAGFVWWIKSAVALVILPVFALYVIKERRLHPKWLFMAAGFVVMVILNGLVFLVMENDFWKIYRMTTSGVSEYVHGQIAKTDPAYYVKLLFLDVKHTWFLGPLAVAGLLLWLRRTRQDEGLALIVIWGVGLVAVLSLFVVSFNPLMFITKQVNYAIAFLAPLALLAGYALSLLNRPLAIVAAAIVVLVGVLGTALEQQAIQSFVANSKAALTFATEHPGREVFGMTNTMRASDYARLFAKSPADVPQIQDLQRLAAQPPARQQNADVSGFVAYAIFDGETADWGKQGLYSNQDSLPKCWILVGKLEPQGMGLGARLVAALAPPLAMLPEGFGHAVARRLAALVNPLPASVYGIRPDCAPAGPGQ